MKRFKDLSNMRFNKLVAIEVDHFQKTKNSTRTYWKCKCDCGNYIVVRSDCLTTGNTQAVDVITRLVEKSLIQLKNINYIEYIGL